MNFGLLCLFLLTVCSITINQNLYLEGLYLTSSSMGSAVGNIIPAITFLISFLAGYMHIYIYIHLYGNCENKIYVLLIISDL